MSLGDPPENERTPSGPRQRESDAVSWFGDGSGGLTHRDIDPSAETPQGSLDLADMAAVQRIAKPADGPFILPQAPAKLHIRDTAFHHRLMQCQFGGFQDGVEIGL